MKTLSLLGCLFISSASFSIEKGKTFFSVDSENEAELTIVDYLPSQYLIKFNVPEHEINGQVKLYNKVLSNNTKNTYFYQLAGLEAVQFKQEGHSLLLNGSSVSYATLQLTDFADIKMVYGGKADILEARRTIERYEQRQNGAVSKIAAKKQIKSSLAEFNTDCHEQLTVDVDWPAFTTSDLKTTPGMMKAYLNSLNDICALDEDYKMAVTDIKTVSVTLSDDPSHHKIELSDQVLSISLAPKQANVHENSYQQILDLL